MARVFPFACPTRGSWEGSMCVMDWGFPLRTSGSQCCRDSISVSQALCIWGMTHWGIQQRIKKTYSRHLQIQVTICALPSINSKKSFPQNKRSRKWKWRGMPRKRAEYGFGEYGFKHRTQWVFWGSLSSGERTQWVLLSLLFVCKRELTEFFAELTEFAPKLTEFSSPKQYSRNSMPPVS